MAEQVKVVWLSGNAHERKLVLERIKGQFSGAEIATYNGDISYAYLESQVYSTNCFSEKKIVILSDLPEPSGTKATMIAHFKKLIDNMPDECLLIFNGIEDEKALMGHVAKAGKVIEYDKVLEKSNAHFWVMKTAQEYGKGISDDDAKALVELNGFDGEAGGLGIDQIRIAIQKVAQYVGRKKIITRDDIVLNSFPSEEFIVWTIFDAMDSKDLVSCLNTMHRMFSEEGGSDGGVSKLLHLALWRYRLLFFLKETLAKGISKADAIREASQLLKLQFTGTGGAMVAKGDDGKGPPKPAYTEYWIGKELNGAYNRPAAVDRYNRKELVRIMQAIEDGLSESRNRTQESSLMIIADVLMFTVCNAMDDTKLAKVRKSYE